MTMPIDLVLVRHGESEGNVALKLSKKGDHSHYTDEFRERHTAHYRLSAEGRKQAMAAGELLREEFPDGFDKYYVSDYVRANETAALLGIPDAEWRVNIYLRERDWGELDNLNIVEREERFADAVLRRKRHPFHWRPPGGESIADVVPRVDRFLATQHRENRCNNVLSVNHGEVIMSFRFIIERLTPYLWQKIDDEFRVENCQIIHYTRVDPDTKIPAEKIHWMRMAVPWRGGFGDWERIKKRKFSNQQLLNYANRFPPIVEK